MKIGNDGPELEAFEGRWPACVDGGYPLVYITEDGGTLCAPCANGDNGSLASEDIDDAQWRIIGADIFYEGGPQDCDHCGVEILSAYGNPDEGGSDAAF